MNEEDETMRHIAVESLLPTSAFAEETHNFRTSEGDASLSLATPRDTRAPFSNHDSDSARSRSTGPNNRRTRFRDVNVGTHLKHCRAVPALRKKSIRAENPLQGYSSAIKRSNTPRSQTRARGSVPPTKKATPNTSFSRTVLQRRIEDRTRYDIEIASLRAELAKKTREIADLQEEDTNKTQTIIKLRNHNKALQKLLHDADFSRQKVFLEALEQTAFAQSVNEIPLATTTTRASSAEPTAQDAFPLSAKDEPSKMEPKKTAALLLRRPFHKRYRPRLDEELHEALEELNAFRPFITPVKEWYRVTAKAWNRLSHAFENINVPPKPTQKILQIAITRLMEERTAVQQALHGLQYRQLSIIKKLMEAPSLYEDLYNELQQVMERFTATERALAQRESELSVVGTSLETLHAQYKEKCHELEHKVLACEEQATALKKLTEAIDAHSATIFRLTGECDAKEMRLRDIERELNMANSIKDAQHGELEQMRESLKQVSESEAIWKTRHQEILEQKNALQCLLEASKDTIQSLECSEKLHSEDLRNVNRVLEETTKERDEIQALYERLKPYHDSGLFQKTLSLSISCAPKVLSKQIVKDVVVCHSFPSRFFPHDISPLTLLASVLPKPRHWRRVTAEGATLNLTFAGAQELAVQTEFPSKTVIHRNVQTDTDYEEPVNKRRFTSDALRRAPQHFVNVLPLTKRFSRSPLFVSCVMDPAPPTLAAAVVQLEAPSFTAMRRITATQALATILPDATIVTPATATLSVSRVPPKSPVSFLDTRTEESPKRRFSQTPSQYSAVSEDLESQSGLPSETVASHAVVKIAPTGVPSKQRFSRFATATVYLAPSRRKKSLSLETHPVLETHRLTATQAVAVVHVEPQQPTTKRHFEEREATVYKAETTAPGLQESSLTPSPSRDQKSPWFEVHQKRVVEHYDELLRVTHREHETLTSSFFKQLDDVHKYYAQQLREATARFNALLTTFQTTQEEHTRSLAQIKERHAEALVQTEETHAQNLLLLQDEHAEKVLKLKEFHHEQILTLKEEHSASLTALRESFGTQPVSPLSSRPTLPCPHCKKQKEDFATQLARVQQDYVTKLDEQWATLERLITSNSIKKPEPFSELSKLPSMTSEPGTTESKRYCSVATMTDTALYSTPSEMKALTAANQRLEQEFQSLLVALEQERITTCELKANLKQAEAKAQQELRDKAMQPLSEREYRWERTVRVDIFPSDSRKAPYDSVSGVTPKRPLLRLPDVAERYRSDYAEARAIDQCDISKQSAYGSCDQLLTDLSVIRRAVRAALRARSHPPSARHKTSCLPNYTTASSRNVLCSPPKQRAALLSPLNLPKTAFLERHYPLFQKSSIPSALFPFALGVPLTAGCPKRDSFPYTSATLAVNNI